MKIQIDKEELQKAVQAVQNIISPRSTLPILSNILIDAQEGSILFISTDLDVGICYTINTQPQEVGGITVPAKKFSDIIRELPDGLMKIIGRKNNTITIEQETSFFKLNGIPKEEFPKFPQLKNKETIVMSQELLKSMINRTAFAVSSDETRYILNGILFEMGEGTLRMVATDGKRLALIEQKISAPKGFSKKIVVPVKTINELNRMLEEGGDLKITIGENQILFEADAKTIVSRLIEGEFPNYQQVIPKEAPDKIVCSRGGLLAALRRASLFVNPESQAVKIDVLKNKIILSKSTPDLGECREELAVSYQGKEMQIGFNPHYLIDVLKHLPQDELSLEITQADKPGAIRASIAPAEDNNYTYIALPMRLG